MLPFILFIMATCNPRAVSFFSGFKSKVVGGGNISTGLPLIKIYAKLMLSKPPDATYTISISWGLTFSISIFEKVSEDAFSTSSVGTWVSYNLA